MPGPKPRALTRRRRLLGPLLALAPIRLLNALVALIRTASPWPLAAAARIAPAQTMNPPTITSTPSTDPAGTTAEPDDPYRWLEEVQGERALAWVRERNAESEALLRAEPGFDALR